MSAFLLFLKKNMWLSSLIFFGIAFAQEKGKNKSSDEFVFGQSANFEGGLGIYGKIIKDALLTCINSVNEHGGIKGKKLKLISLNDGGDPLITQKNIDYFLSRGIDTFVGNMGTRSILKVLPYIQDKKIAMLFPWSGDEKLRDQHLTNIINGAGLLAPQITAILDYIEENIKLRKIAVFHADDDFSTTAANGLIEEMKRRNLSTCATASYNRFTIDIGAALTTLLASDPKIIICISTATPVVKLINSFFSKGHYGTIFFGIDSTFFVPDIIGSRGVDFYYSSAFFYPAQNNCSIAKQYMKDLKKSFPYAIPNVLSFSYYVSMSIIVDAMNHISGQITKEKIINYIERMENVSLGGLTITFDKTNRQAFGNKIVVIKG